TTIQAIYEPDAPVFTIDPIVKSDAVEGVSYSGSIAGSAIDPTNDPLTYSIVSGPLWLTIASNGDLSGTPGAGDVGPNSWNVEVNDGNGGTDQATLEITVLLGGQPVFTTDLINRASVVSETALSDSIAGEATDSDGDPLTYSIASGPLWLTIASNGDLSGTPGKWDEGLNGWTVLAHDGNGGSGYATLVIEVVSSFTEAIYEAEDAVLSGAVVASNIADYTGTGFVDYVNASGDYIEWTVSAAAAGEAELSFRYALSSGDRPLEVQVNGQVVASSLSFPATGAWTTWDYTATVPVTLNAGDNTVRTTAIGSSGGNIDHLLVGVFSSGEPNTPPVFTADPINKQDATEAEAYSDTITGSATDADSDPLTYSKASGPAWLSVAADGMLSGTPATGDVGANAFTVQVDDGNGGTDQSTLNITVTADTTPPAAPAGLSALEGIGLVDLDWADNTESDLDSYTVYRSITSGSEYAVIATGVATSDYTDSTAANHTMYYYVVTASDANANESANSGEASAQPGFVTDSAASDIAVLGSVSGTLADVEVNDDTYQAITEVINGNTSALEHKWVFNVTGAELVTLYVEAHHSANSEGDNFIFAYSTDDVDYTDMVTVAKTADDNTVQYYALPSGLNGTVYVRVLDADRTDSNTQLDTISVDALFIVSEESTVPPNIVSAPAPANGATDVVVDAQLGWIAGLMTASHDIYFGTSASPVFQGNQPGTTFDPGALLNGTIYYWAVDELNNTGTTAGPVWSFTTVAAPNLPPAFTADPFSTANGTENAAYSASIAGDASDPESDPMTFSKVSGPTWLNVASDGTLSGTPLAGDVGLNAFTVQVDATGGSDTATLNITVDEDVVPLPGIASSPNPVFRARDVTTTPTLSWVAGSDTVSHNVYFGTVAGSPAFMGNQTGTTFAPGTLANKVKYYWRIDEVNAAGTTTGTEWSFTTVR
ncbi:MAG: hypothetical protein KAU94_07125, partial [Verrucomicrobia bacterium]|nr:hypothetical protein [Verrucomicrobiota bacterium]